MERDSLINLIGGGYLDSLSSSYARTPQGRSRLLKDTRRLPKKRKGNAQSEIPIHPASWWFSLAGHKVEQLPSPPEEIESEEWRVFGLNVSRHPLAPYREALIRDGVTPAADATTLPHRSRVRVAGLLETLQRPPTKSGAVVHFLLIEDESGVLQATIFEDVYRKYGHVLHQTGAYLLDGSVEHDSRRGTSYLVSGIRRLDDVLERAQTRPDVTPAGSGAFIRARRRGRRAG